MSILERAFARIARTMLYVSAIALLVMTALVVTASFMRYLLGRPFDFTEELVALLYMSLVFLAIPLVTVERSHISISVLPAQLQKRIRGLLRAGASLVMIAFCTWFTIETYAFVEESRRFNSKSEQVEILLWPWMAVIPITAAFVTIIAVFQLFRNAQTSPPADGEVRQVGDSL